MKKTINRDNYDEYFLLYADNELDAETMLTVENFVQQNTDLAVELEMLMRTKSTPEKIVFTDKDLLLKTEGNSINETNYEEYFLLYIDNELSVAKREEVEMYVLQHPNLQHDFTTLKQAVLIPEEVNFYDKKDLYRTVKKRTVYLQPWRLAAAAIFIGVCAIGWWLLQKPAQKNAVADNHSTLYKTKQNIVMKPVDTIHEPIKKPEQIVSQQSLPSIKNEIEEKKITTKKKDVTVEKNENDVAEHKPLQQKNKFNNSTNQSNNVTQKLQPAVENNNVAIEPVLSNKDKTVTTLPQAQESSESNNTNYKLYDVAYKEINTNDDENSLHVGGFDLNKNKVKNLFKKAGRLFGNKAIDNANEDGKLQVANFEIQTNKQ